MKVMIADDHGMVRTGLTLLLQRLFGEVLIFEAGNYEEALSVVRAQPDLSLAMVDRVMPGYDNGEGLKRLFHLLSSTPVVILSASEEVDDIEEAMKLGARGYLPKAMDESLLSSALQLILAGGMYMPACHSKTDSGERQTESEKRANEVSPSLTPRQHDILIHLAVGATNKDIARHLSISPATVQTHVNAIFRALSVTNRTQAVHVANSLGLV